MLSSGPGCKHRKRNQKRRKRLVSLHHLTRRGHLQENPPEPDPGMLSPGPRKTVGGQPKPSTSAQQRLKPKKPSAQSVNEAQAELKRILAEKREEKRKKAAARMAKKSSQKAPKGGVKKRYRYRPGTVALK